MEKAYLLKTGQILSIFPIVLGKTALICNFEEIMGGG